MKINLDSKPLDEIVADVLRMEDIVESEQESLMSGIGKEIKKQVKALLPRSDSTNDGYSWGSGYEHMRDDIKVTVNGKKAKIGISGVTVHGGRDTGYKWHLLDDGTRNPDGSVHTPATHFTSKALKAAEPKIESLVNDLERKVVEGDRK